jgi:hypothetical protein
VPVVPGHLRTPAQLNAELASMPADFVRTKIPPILLRREGEEILTCRGDVPVFQARGIPVQEGHFALVEQLMALLPESRSEREEAAVAYSGFDEKEDAHAPAIRAVVERLGRLVLLNGLSESLTTLGDADGNLRLMDAALAVAARVERVGDAVQPAAERIALIQDIRARVEAMMALRASQAGETGLATITTDRIHRVKRLLLDTLRYVGNAGLYVFGDDPTRQSAYRLQHISAWGNRYRPAPAPHGAPT